MAQADRGRPRVCESEWSKSGLEISIERLPVGFRRSILSLLDSQEIARKIMVSENKDTEIRRSLEEARHYTVSGLFAELNKTSIPNQKNLNWQ